MSAVRIPISWSLEFGLTSITDTDHGGNDLSASSANSFDDCFPICNQTNGCVGFSFTGGDGPGTCYLKSAIGSGSSNDGVDSAYIEGAPSTSPSLGGSDGAGSCQKLGNGTVYDGYNLGECSLRSPRLRVLTSPQSADLTTQAVI